MKAVDRRGALSLGLAATAAAFVAADAAAQQVSSTGGKEVAPGVHRVEHGKRESMIPGYQRVTMVDIVYQPKAKLASGDPMHNDMVCHCPQGELRVKQSEGMEFVAKPGDLWTCKKGILEETENIGDGVAIMRIINLLPA